MEGKRLLRTLCLTDHRERFGSSRWQALALLFQHRDLGKEHAAPGRGRRAQHQASARWSPAAAPAKHAAPFGMARSAEQ